MARPLPSLSFREIYEETGLTIQNPQLVGIKNWPLDTGERYIVFLLQGD